MNRIRAFVAVLTVVVVTGGCDSVREVDAVWEEVDVPVGTTQIIVDVSGPMFALAISQVQDSGPPNSLWKRGSEKGAWSNVAVPNGFHVYAIRSTAPGVVYAWGHDYGQITPQWGLLVSRDSGSSWNHLEVPNTFSTPLELTGDDAGWVAVPTTFGLEVSRNGGVSWENTWTGELAFAENYLAGPVFLSRAGTAYVNVTTRYYDGINGHFVYWSSRIWASHDRGGTWHTTDLPEVVDDIFRGFTESPNGVVYLTGSNRIYRSSDDGATWELVAELAGLDRIFAVSFTPEGKLLLGSTLPGKSYGYTFRISSDGGTSWTPFDTLDEGAPFSDRLIYLPMGNDMSRPLPSFTIGASGRTYAFIPTYSGPLGKVFRTR